MPEPTWTNPRHDLTWDRITTWRPRPRRPPREDRTCSMCGITFHTPRIMEPSSLADLYQHATRRVAEMCPACFTRSSRYIRDRLSEEDVNRITRDHEHARLRRCQSCSRYFTPDISGCALFCEGCRPGGVLGVDTKARRSEEEEGRPQPRAKPRRKPVKRKPKAKKPVPKAPPKDKRPTAWDRIDDPILSA